MVISLWGYNDSSNLLNLNQKSWIVFTPRALGDFVKDKYKELVLLGTKLQSAYW